MGMFENSFTLAYYNKHADSFIDDTENVDFHEIQDEFLTYVPKGGHILDMGCGSGRDSLYFLKKGYTVDAIDGSPRMCARARMLTDLNVECELFEFWQPHNMYDGVWACASLLHIWVEDLDEVIDKVASCLKDGGIFYMSFKYGDSYGTRNGRFFNDFNEDKVAKMVRKSRRFKTVKVWQTFDVRPGREEEKWMNVLLSKKK